MRCSKEVKPTRSGHWLDCWFALFLGVTIGYMCQYVIDDLLPRKVRHAAWDVQEAIDRLIPDIDHGCEGCEPPK